MEEKRKWLAILISICLVVTLIPSAVFADADGGTNIDNAIMLGTSGIDDIEFVYLGDYDYNGNNYNLPWLVLDSEKTNMGTDGIFTLSWYCLKEVNQQQDLSRNDLYSSSKRRTWCQEFFNGDSLSNKEKKLAVETYKSDDAYNVEEKSLASNIWGTYSTESEDNILNGDQIFLLSVEERINYLTPTTPICEVRLPGEGIKVTGNTLHVDWFLRSRLNALSEPQGKPPKALFLSWCGGVYNNPIFYTQNYYTFYERPAMNIDKDRILFTSPASGGKESGDVGAEALAHVGEYAAEVFFASAQQWKLTIYDEVRAGFGAYLNAESDGNCVAGKTIKIDYSGAQTGTDEYISAMIVDEEGNVLYYGNLVNNNEEGVTEGTADLRLPAELPVGSYTLKVFNEQLNGDYKTDYSSQLIDIPLTISDPAPVLIPVSGERSSLSKATVKFTASEDVTYYYAVVEKGDPAPTIDTDEEKGRCLAGEETISLTDLTTAGAKDIYIVGKDSGGNLSNVIKIEIPKYKASYIPSEPPHTHEFGEWTVVKEPTETETGLKEHSCKCGYKETEEIPMLTSSEPAKPEAPADTDGEKEIAGSDDRYSNGLAAERGEGESSNVPKTGDTSDIPYWFALLALSFAGLIITLRKTCREKSRR